MARAVRLDFVTARRAPVRAGIAVLVAGVAALAAMLIDYRDVRSETSALELRIADFRRMSRREQPPIREAGMDARALAQEIRQANVVLAQLNVPWGALFRELEAASVDGITLLAIQPDVASGQVRIAGEAKTYAFALAYVSALEASDRFANVFLTSHEVRANTPQRPVIFALVADWSAP
jgi:hypothetical protein